MKFARRGQSRMQRSAAAMTSTLLLLAGCSGGLKSDLPTAQVYVLRPRLAAATAATPPAGTVQLTPPVRGETTGMAQPSGSSNQPKLYQPANPAPDTRSSPTSSDTGVGPNNGSTGQPK